MDHIMKRLEDPSEDLSFAAKLAHIALHGVKKVSLSRREKEFLCGKGLEEIFSYWDTPPGPFSTLEPEIVDDLMARVCSHQGRQRPEEQFNLKIDSARLLHVSLIFGQWIPHAPAFAIRQTITTNHSFSKKIGRQLMQIQFTPAPHNTITILVCLTGGVLQKKKAIETRVFKNGRFCEEIGPVPLIVLRTLVAADYRLEIRTKGHLVDTIDLRLEQ